jgi:hypothetical protein
LWNLETNPASHPRGKQAEIMEGNSSPHHSYPASQHPRGKHAAIIEGNNSPHHSSMVVSPNTKNRTIKNKKMQHTHYMIMNTIMI